MPSGFIRRKKAVRYMEEWLERSDSGNVIGHGSRGTLVCTRTLVPGCVEFRTLVNSREGSVLFTTFTGLEADEDSREEILEYANRKNEKAVSTRVVVDDDDDIRIVYTVACGKYVEKAVLERAYNVNLAAAIDCLPEIAKILRGETEDEDEDSGEALSALLGGILSEDD